MADSVPIYLKDLPAADRDREFHVFKELPAVARLAWPVGVVEQWLYDHGRHLEFLDDYGTLDLGRIWWALEDVAVTELQAAPTGSSDQDWLDEVAADHRRWLSQRPQKYRDAWEDQGSWLVPPVLITRDLLHPQGRGLQVVEGRMRLGILQGRLADGLHVASSHKAWVGSAR